MHLLTTRLAHRLAFTLVELLVVIAIIGVLLGIALPAVQGMRELARRATCSENMTRLNLAMTAYDMRFGHYPVGTQNPTGPIRNLPVGQHHNWIAALLPQLEANNLFQKIDFSVSVYAPENEPVRNLALPFLQCPSSIQSGSNATSYAGVHNSHEAPIDIDNDGVFILNRAISPDDIPDGLAYTLAIGEKTSTLGIDLGWLSGTRASLRNAGHPPNANRHQKVADPDPLVVGGFSSDHRAGVQFVDCAGGTRFLSKSVDMRLFGQMAGRADGEIPLDWTPTQVGGELDETLETSPLETLPSESTETATPKPSDGEANESDAEPADPQTTAEVDTLGDQS